MGLIDSPPQTKTGGLSAARRSIDVTLRLRAEALSAAAAARGLRIRDRESGAAEILDVIHLRVLQIRRALRIHDDFDAARLDYHVVLFLLIEREPVLEPGAASALDEDAQRLALRVGHRAREVLDLLDRLLRQR